MAITFNTSILNRNGDRDTVDFRAMEGESLVICRVTREALSDYTRTSGSDLVDMFRASEVAIINAVDKKYAASDREPDGSIIIRSADLI